MCANSRSARFFTEQRQRRIRRRLKIGTVLAVLCGLQMAVAAGTKLPNPLNSTDITGTLQTYSTAGGVDQSNPFFQSLGTNGRACGSCHVSSDAWSITPADLLTRFNNTQGLDPVFQPVDGANCPSDDVSTLSARQAAYSLLLSKGLIRISIAMPSGADFSIQQISIPTAVRRRRPASPRCTGDHCPARIWIS